MSLASTSGFTYIIGELAFSLFQSLFMAHRPNPTLLCPLNCTEHMEEDDETPRALPRWVELEYNVCFASPAPIDYLTIFVFPTSQHMRTLAGPYSSVKFTHLSRTAQKSLSDAFTFSASSVPTFDPSAPPQVHSSRNETSQNITAPKTATLGLAKASCLEEGIMHLLENSSCELKLENVCLLDPKAEKELSPEDGDGRFSGFLFGVSGSAFGILPRFRCL